MKPVKRALVDGRSPYGYLKSHYATKQEAQLQRVEQSAFLYISLYALAENLKDRLGK